MGAYWCELAVVGEPSHGTVAHGVLVETRGGAVSAVRAGTEPPPGATRLAGLVLPGLANAHCHAFHRALRGRTQAGVGDFWAWREAMYQVAGGLDPDSYKRLARATYAEMTLAGITTVGEFHYLHHGPGGVPYADPNAMGEALVVAAAEAGIRLTLLDTCYLQGNVDGAPLGEVQQRFGDRDAEAWAARTATWPGELAATGRWRPGAAIHSVRAVPPQAMATVAGAASGRDQPLHAHLSEQRAENEACRAVLGATPAQVLADAGALSVAATMVHATHLDPADVAALGRAGATACLCPTTERDLADGVGPARALAGAGSPLCLGTDSQAVVDLFEEARAVELDERLATERRGHHRPADLLAAATSGGAASLGWGGGGRIA
ncbi:MAG TPA: formimidoylglutamate deiminase, partial [Acidimicrobiales bacterium]|nr:formimidoylglutamate deiminase [Acidimicrobiales bacterium]